MLTDRLIEEEIKIAGHAADPYFDNISLSDHANDFLRGYIDTHLDKNSVVLDVGANIGLTSVLFARKAGKVISFEPSQKAFAALQRTIEINHVKNCQLHNLALADQHGTVSFADNPTSASASHLIAGGSFGTATYDVGVTTVDTIAADFSRLDLIKIDVEGHESNVMRGAVRTIDRLKSAVFVEYNAFTLMAYGNVNPRRFLESLLDTFPHVYRCHDGKVSEMRDSGSVLTFIHDNIVYHGAVDDLLCSHAPLTT